MTALNNNINIPKGTSASISVTVCYADGSPYPYNAADTVRLAVKHDVNQPTADLSKTAVYDPDTAAYIFTFAPEDTAAMLFDRYWYDVGLQTADGDYFMIITKSEFNITPAISQKVVT